MVTYEEALGILLAEAEPLPPEQVMLGEAGGRILAESFMAPHPWPAGERAAMDGYALRSADTAGASASVPARLCITQGETVAPGEALPVATGFPLPPGADAVVAQERTVVVEGHVLLGRFLPVGEAVARVGSDVPAAGELLPAGERLGPPALGLLAAYGAARLWVHARPTVGLLSVGEELVEPWQQPLPGGYRDQNRTMLAAVLGAMGAVVRDLGTVPDREEAVRERLRSAGDLSLLVTTGGVSGGRNDRLPGILEAHADRLLFWRVAIRPGKPVVGARIGRTLVIALPGSPGAALVDFEVLVRPVVRRLQGVREVLPPTRTVFLAADYPKPSPVRRFLRARTGEDGEGRTWAHLLPAQGAEALSSLVNADVLVTVPEESPPLPAGTRLSAAVFGQWDR